MIVTNGYEQYKKQGVMTAGAGDLIIMLYDGCIKNLNLAKLHINQKDIQGSNNAILKAQDIIYELIKGLDFKIQLSNELYKIYDYLIFELTNANIKKDIKKLDAVLEIVQEFKETWVEVVRLNRVSSFKMEEISNV